MISGRKLGDRGQAEVGVLLLGSGSRARRIAERLQLAERRPIRIVGFLDDEPSDEDIRTLGASYLGRLERLAELAARGSVGWVIFALPRRFLALEATANAIGLCETLGIDFTIPVDLFDTRVSHVLFSEVAGVSAVSFSVQGRHSRLQLAAKRVLDIIGACVV
jgi:FlaA1/EpsC-like NDP-sugar epimerase